MRDAVFTGAGISGARPARLPMGNTLRDAVLQVMHTAAVGVAPDLVTADALTAFTRSGRKLEVVMGRLWQTVGDDALGCLGCLRVTVPNEAHMLAAVHLLRGGTHVTVNFDRGVETACGLLLGTDTLPDGAVAALHDALPAWRRLVPAGARPPRFVASHDEFAAWEAANRPAALLKVHGGLAPDQSGLLDVVVVDNEELGALSRPRRAAVDGLARAGRLLVTGYAGADPDVYGPLLDAAPRPDPTGTARTAWACYSLVDGSPVPDDCSARGMDLRLGPPAGLATTALRDLLGLGPAPGWPEEAVPGPGWDDRFRAWREALAARHDDRELTLAWAWLVADSGDLDHAVRLYRRLLHEHAQDRARLPLADALYTRAGPGDRDEAGAEYRRAALAGATRPDVRTHCLLRSAGVARGRALTAGPVTRRALAAAWANTAPLVVLLLGANGRDPEAGPRACGVLMQNALRMLELAGTVAPPPARPPLGVACLAAAALGPRAATTANGNARALARTHRLTLLALARLWLPGGIGPDPSVGLRSLRDTYHNADDLPGAGNCTIALAVCAAADGRPGDAAALLATARRLYADGRPDGRPVAAGAALLDRVRILLSPTPP